MNEYIFYIVDDYISKPKEREDINNYQVFGKIFGKNEKEVKNQLRAMYPSITNCGVDTNRVICKQVLTEENKKDINMILEYLMEEEFNHYQESEEPENHIYKVLLRLKDMIC